MLAKREGNLSVILSLSYLKDLYFGEPYQKKIYQVMDITQLLRKINVTV